ncbi:MAG: lipid A biosynthesis acyltransferase [Bacteroidota bacterium]|jgi:KDO2-lipid IV(A) lauroyltransferase|nr:lipid A biosynthesis acyltransferase [Bacteroidota bacterium]
MYYIVFALFYLLSLLPWRVIYGISDIFYVIIYYIIRYRRKVVDENLRIAFPEKSEVERKKIAKEFYRQFTDTFVETIKLISISGKELDKRVKADYETINQLYASGKNVQILLGHFFNWELANVAYAQHLLYKFIVVYKPIENKIFNRLFLHIRGRFGTLLVSASNFKKEFAAVSKQQYALILVGDQNPGKPDNTYWFRFFDKPAPFVKGPELSARYNDTAVVFCNFYREKRGYYRSEATVFTTTPKTLPEAAITKAMIAFIEEEIRKRPANYLWSHRRWKWAFQPEKHSHLLR